MSGIIPNNGYLMIIGAMKCGTSSLYHLLAQHPEVCPASRKEAEYFSENQGRGAEVDRYEDLWKFDSSVHKYAIEASTGYTKYSSELNVSKNIWNYGIRPKFIYIIRDPFERIESQYNFLKNKGELHCDIDSNHFIELSNYYLQLEQYLEYFPKEDILLVDFDDFKSDPKSVLTKAYQFLEISGDFFPENYKVRNVTNLESNLVRRLRKLRRSTFKTLFDMLPLFVTNMGKNLLSRTPTPKKRILSDSERLLVHNKLDSSMIKLRNEFGINVEKWGFTDLE